MSVRLHRRRLVALAVSAALAVSMSVVIPSARASGADFVRQRKLSAQEVASHVIPRGGIKTAMSGGNVVGSSLREKHARRDGYKHIDTPRLIQRLRAAHVNMYTFGVWDSPTDWDDLRFEFAPAAQRAGIRIMVYLAPPSECAQNSDPVQSGRCSRPYLLNFVEWARQVATLSRQYKNVVAWAIDDFVIGQNLQTFTPAYMKQIVDTADAINPYLGFYTTAYYSEAIGSDFYDRFAPYIDGIIHPYLGGGGTQDATETAKVIDAILRQTAPRHLSLILLVYTGRFLDGNYPPTETYVNDVMQAAAPYVADGRVAGIVAYGMPMDDKPAMTSDNRAESGNGRLAFTLCGGCGTSAGQFAQAEQTVRVDPHAKRYQITFDEKDGYEGNASALGYHIKQVLVDGQVVWESDVQDPIGFSWQHHTVDLTSALSGKSSAAIAIRLYERNGVGSFPLNVGFDNVAGSGFTLKNGGFETDDAWTLSRNNTEVLHVALDHYAKDRPSRIRAAIAANFAGRSYKTPGFTSSGFRQDDDAMYGHGRLSLRVPLGGKTVAGACATASQVVRVDPKSARYELSFWHIDQWDGPPSFGNQQIKTVQIDGKTVFSRDVLDPWANFWINGHDWQGPIDVTSLVSGKKTVTLSFGLCEKADGGFPVDVGFDNIETVGLHVKDPGFETGHGWTLHSSGGVTALVKVARH